MENITNNITNNITEKDTQTQQDVQQDVKQGQQKLKDIPIENENIALNVLVGMLNIAQKRGAFNMEESAKAWECVQMFMKSPESQ